MVKILNYAAVTHQNIIMYYYRELLPTPGDCTEMSIFVTNKSDHRHTLSSAPY